MHEKILIIEDEKDLRTIYSAILEEEGFDVSVATDFGTAIAILESQVIEVIFSDIILGGRTGVDILRTVREKRLNCPVVLITGVPTVETAAEAVRLGAYDYIPKPVSPETLIRVASMALRFKTLNAKYEASRKNLEAIFSSVKDAIITVDENLLIIEMNDAAQGLCGPKDLAVGSPIGSVLKICSDELYSALMETMRHSRMMEIKNITCIQNDTTERVVALNTYPLVRNKNDISGAVMIIKDETRLTHLEKELRERRQFQKIIGGSGSMQEIYSLIEDLSNVNTTVLITGESGTGKELVAEAIHYAGRRKDRPLVKVNCAALSENLLDSELFGHVRGAFTGAIKDKPGKFEIGEGGTIFLDEIGDISPALQSKLLRVLQDKKVERVGDNTPLSIDVRIMAATNRNLRNKIKEGMFREDLFYRLKVVEIHLPPLRDRKEDIPLLAEHILGKLNRKLGKAIRGLSDEVMEIFMEHSWPGNIRELEHEMEHASIRCREHIISLDNLSSDFSGFIKAAAERTGEQPDSDSILEALEKAGWNKAKAARYLGVSRGTLYKLIKEHNLEDPK